MASATDSMIWAPIDKNGNIYQTPSPDNASKPTRGTSELGKDAFLQLLVAQMKYQDPLNPTSDTEWISQMATFSSLEEMQNMNTTLTNAQALNLVGKVVIINSEDRLVAGRVDYVCMQKGKAYLMINDEPYSIDDLDTVASEEYLKKLQESGMLDSDKTDTDKTDTDGDKTDTDNTDTDKDKTDTEDNSDV